MVGLPQNKNEVFIACITKVLHSHIALLLYPLTDDGKLPIESLEFIIERQCLFQWGHACEVKERIPWLLAESLRTASTTERMKIYLTCEKTTSSYTILDKNQGVTPSHLLWNSKHSLTSQWQILDIQVPFTLEFENFGSLIPGSNKFTSTAQTIVSSTKIYISSLRYLRSL